MCGIASVINIGAHETRVDESTIVRMRDRLTHRGPDDSGLWFGPIGAIGHRRLKVIDLSEQGHQPMLSADGRYVLAYNGELYNDHDLRAQLATLGARFRSTCDTETFLQALIHWGMDAMEHVRGMFAFVFIDTQERRVIMGRDPMGIKPLYRSFVEHDGHTQMIVGSEIPSILEHPKVNVRPDPVTLSAYLSSVRTTLGKRTMFDGIETLIPGEWIELDLDQRIETNRNWWGEQGDVFNRVPSQGVRGTIIDSIHRHLRTDVPMCTLLSGGLDSAITSKVTSDSYSGLNTFCAGAKSEGFDHDFRFAQELAGQLGTKHHEIEIDQDGFVDRWDWMIGQLGVPLSTPNEVAIYEVSKALSDEGHVVAISGEGADELFGGYGPIMQQCCAHIASLEGKDDVDGGLFHLKANAWISEELKPGVLKSEWYSKADGDVHLRSYYKGMFEQIRSNQGSGSSLETHLRFQRAMNLPTLLQRLDSSTMLASVEGRTPYSDIEVAICAMALPMDMKYVNGEDPLTKIALRDAFKGELPDQIVNRPKASFPMPFQHWMGPMTDRLFKSEIARSFFSEQAIGLVCARPASYWHMAWPMINLMLWGEHWLSDTPSKEYSWRSSSLRSTTLV